jgi:hypothetical protein
LLIVAGGGTSCGRGDARDLADAGGPPAPESCSRTVDLPCGNVPIDGRPIVPPAREPLRPVPHWRHRVCRGEAKVDAVRRAAWCRILPMAGGAGMAEDAGEPAGLRGGCPAGSRCGRVGTCRFGVAALRVEILAAGQRIRAEEPRGPLFVVAALLLAASAGWEWLWLGMPGDVPGALANLRAPPADGPPREIAYAMLALPLLVLPMVVRHAWIALVGQVVAIDGIARQITRNGKLVARFAEVESIELRRGHLEADLVVHLRQGGTRRAGPICPVSELAALRQRIADIAGGGLPLRPEPRPSPVRRRDHAVVLGMLRLLRYGFLLGAAAAFMLSVAYVIGGERATGVVVERATRETSGEDGVTVVCTIAFTDAQGRQRRFDTATGTATRAVGESVPVIYFARDPSWVRVDDFDHFWGLPLGLLIFGLVLIPFAWIVRFAVAVSSSRSGQPGEQRRLR